MQLADFSFDLPEGLIARYPASERTLSNLLVLDKHTGVCEHKKFLNFMDYLKPNDVLVLNDTKVLHALLPAQKETGGKLEIMLERALDENSFLAGIKVNRPIKEGVKLFVGDLELVADRRVDSFWVIRIISSGITVDELFTLHGKIPLPPYMHRVAEGSDEERYQTVYAKNKGAVAVPSAGLHFDNNMLDKIKKLGVKIVKVTLHVGAGTYKPVQTDNIKEHKMHSEEVTCSEEAVDEILAAKQLGGRVIAVGTTVVRTLETAAKDGKLSSYQGSTDIYIYPGYKFKVIDMLLTNFHLSGSSLIMLVSALAGRENILSAYNEAIERKYRFFTYGDAMLITDGSYEI